MKMNAAIYNPIDQAKESVSRSWLQLCADTSGEDRRHYSSLTNKRAPTGQYRTCNTGYGTPDGRWDPAGRKRHLPSSSTLE